MADTIFAQATAPGRAGVAIIRISGPAAHEAATRLAGPPLPPRRAVHRRVVDPCSGETIDDAVLIHFPAPASFTGETVVEIQCHGSQAVTRRLLDALALGDGYRLAQPGEFTRRALENGRLDLVQVEGLADLLASETEAQRRQAMLTASGAVSARVASFQRQLLELLALVEAVIDFGDDGVPETALGPVCGGIVDLSARMNALLSGSSAAERIREGFVVALCGAPNVGKSTLLNTIAGREVALTSEIAGTTRDVLEVHIDLNGLPVTLLDTAGLRRVEEDGVERLGIERALVRSEAADLRVFLSERTLSANEKRLQHGDIIVRAKADLNPAATGLGVSGLTGEGVEELLQEVSKQLEVRTAGASGLSHGRQRAAVQRACSSLDRALEQLTSDEGLDLAAFELRDALRALDLLTGRVNVEAVLDEIFKGFCLGK